MNYGRVYNHLNLRIKDIRELSHKEKKNSKSNMTKDMSLIDKTSNESLKCMRKDFNKVSSKVKTTIKVK